MRRKDKQITDVAIIEEILTKSEVCRIAMIDEGRPYIVPVNYGYANNVIYIHSAPAGRKMEILKKNNQVCFEIEYASEIIKNEVSCEWSAKYRSVIGYGTIEIVTDFEEKKNALDVIMAHYGKTENNIYKEKQVEFIVVLKLKIDEISGKQSGDWN